jgi:hypothetical protein
LLLEEMQRINLVSVWDDSNNVIMTMIKKWFDGDYSDVGM